MRKDIDSMRAMVVDLNDKFHECFQEGSGESCDDADNDDALFAERRAVAIRIDEMSRCLHILEARPSSLDQRVEGLYNNYEAATTLLHSRGCQAG